MKKKKKDLFLTFTKKMVILVLFISIIWVTWSYILATISIIKYGNSDIVESVSIEVVRVLVATILGYFCKAYFETKQEERNKLLKQKLNNNINDNILQEDPNPINRNFSDVN